MALRRFALIILIGFFPGSNAAVAADDVEAVDVSERKTIADVSVGVADLSKSVTVRGEPWRIRRAKNPTGSLFLIRNETDVPLIASFAAEDPAGACEWDRRTALRGQRSGLSRGHRKRARRKGPRRATKVRRFGRRQVPKPRGRAVGTDQRSVGTAAERIRGGTAGHGGGALR